MTILENTIHFPDSGIILFKTFSLILPLVDSSIVNEAIKTISSQFFLWKDFERTKTQIKPKATFKTKKKQTKNNKGNNFLHINLLRGWKLFALRFDAFCALKIFS